MIVRIAAALLALAVALTPSSAAVLSPHPAPASHHTFSLGERDFLLDGQPFQIISGELHPARIPPAYWRHRIRMAKAMGVNTIALYVFWNYHERGGIFDFTSEGRDIARFIRIAQEEGLWVLLRPGPYVCAEWDFGGIPPDLLADPELKVRSLNPHYMAAVSRYISALARVVRPLLVAHGGPILMVQIENEYGSYGNDRAYLARLRELWTRHGVDGPFYTADGPTPYMLEAGHVDGAAVGLDSGTKEEEWDLARSIAPRVPVFSAETYPGWLTHWGERWARPPVEDLLKEVRFLLDARKSFNFYVVHGGTNFGFNAGANAGGKGGYEPDVTSYDYDAPIDEQGRATSKYVALRDLIGSYLPGGASLPAPPDPIPSIEIPAFAMRPYASIWDHLPAPIAALQPRPFEVYGQNQGLMLYRTTLVGRTSGKLTITDLHDYALVFVDGQYVGALDRRLGENTIDVPATGSPAPVLDILVEGMGHINFGPQIIDRKGITDRVTLGSMTLMNWKVYPLPLTDAWARALSASPSPGARRGLFFRGSFTLDHPADTFLDMTGYRKGVVWVNGHNLGRYWDIGPQMRLYCPAPWLRTGANDVLVFDLQKTDASPVRGVSAVHSYAVER